MFLNENLTVLRKENGLTYRQLSQLTEITVNKLYRLENDENVDPRIKDIIKLSSFFKMSIDDLVNKKM